MSIEENKLILDDNCNIIEIEEVEVQRDIYFNCCGIVQFD